VPSLNEDFYWDTSGEPASSGLYHPPFEVFNAGRYDYVEKPGRCCPAQNDLTVTLLQTDDSQPLYTGAPVRTPKTT
jgi:hypothetical protein